jgi:hypothetical protein
VPKPIDAIERGGGGELKAWNCGWHTEDEIEKILGNG